MKSVWGVAVGLGICGSLLAATSVNAMDSDVYVVHGINGADLDLDPALPVDIEVNGDCALKGFTFGEIAGPLPFAAGTYDIFISLANDLDPCSNDPVIEAPGIMVEEMMNYSIVANLTEAGAPTANVFVNDTSDTSGDARVIVQHTAAAPNVDIRLRRAWPWWYAPLTLENVANGDQGTVMVDPSRYYASIKVSEAAAGDDDDDDDDNDDGRSYWSWRDLVFGPARLDLSTDVIYLVYAVGTPANDTFELLIKAIDAPDRPAQAYIFHGIPGEDLDLDPALPVDISVNGECAIKGFTFGDLAGPVEFAPGMYDIAIGVANADMPCSEAPVITADGVEVMSGENYLIAANLAQNGDPTATVLPFDLSTSGGNATVLVNHLASAPPVDVEVRRKWRWYGSMIEILDLSNGNQERAEIRPGRWNAALFPAGEDDAVFGPVSLRLRPFTAYAVFAVGSLDNETFDLIIKPMSSK